MKILFLSNLPDGSHFRLGSHHLAHQLSIAGHDVAHVSTPISTTEILIGREVKSRKSLLGNPHLTDAQRALSRGRRLSQEGVVHAQPRPLVPVRWRRESSYYRDWLRRTLAFTPDVIFIDELHLIPIARAAHGSATIVYRAVDSAFTGLGRRLEASLLDICDGVAACSSIVLDEITSTGYEGPTVLLENGVDSTFFEPGPNWSERAGVVYVGALDDRFDWTFVDRLARDIPTTRITIVGPGGESRPPLPDNVDCIGGVAFKEVPSLLRQHRVGILPMTADPRNQGRSPMKYYEYLAAGLFVVASWSETLALRSNAPGVTLYEREGAGVAEVRRYLGREATNEAARPLAMKRLWSRVANDLIAFASALR